MISKSLRFGSLSVRYVAKWGIAQMCLCETKYPSGGIAPFWGAANLPEKVSRDMRYRSDSIAISRDMGPLSLHVELRDFYVTPEKEFAEKSFA